MGKFFEVRSGTTRIVFLIGKYAIKIPVLNSWRGFLKGLLANANERNIWHLCPDYFLPVHWSLPGGWVVCMPRARTCTKEGPWYYCFMADLFHGDNDDNVEASIARRYCEAFHRNIGWYKGRPICIDYGSYQSPDQTEEAINAELFYLKVKTKQLHEKIYGKQEPEDQQPGKLVEEPYTVCLERLDIPSFTATVESTNRDLAYGLDEVSPCVEREAVGCS